MDSCRWLAYHRWSLPLSTVVAAAVVAVVVRRPAAGSPAAGSPAVADNRRVEAGTRPAAAGNRRAVVGNIPAADIPALLPAGCLDTPAAVIRRIRLCRPSVNRTSITSLRNVSRCNKKGG